MRNKTNLYINGTKFPKVVESVEYEIIEKENTYLIVYYRTEDLEIVKEKFLLNGQRAAIFEEKSIWIDVYE